MSSTCGRIASLERRLVGDVGVERRHPPDRRFEVGPAAPRRPTPPPRPPNPAVSTSSCTTSEPVGAAHRLADDLVVPRRDGAQVDDLDLGAVRFLRLLRRLQRLLDRGAPRHDRDVVGPVGGCRRRRTGARSPPAGYGSPCRAGAAGACARGRAPGLRTRNASAAARPASPRARRERDQQPGDVGEDRLAALAVPDGRRR